jgi:chitinase
MHPHHSPAITFLQAAIIVLILATAVRSAVAQDEAHPNPNHLPKRLVADYTAGSKYLDPPYDVAQIPFSKLTHIIHAGVPWNSDGSLAVPSGFVEPQLIKRAHKKGVKVMLLTGGDFGAIESSPDVFNTVIANLQNFVTTNGYDGLDIDWEFPSNDTDRAFFVTLMTRLREAFPRPHYTLSADLAPWNISYYNLKRLKDPADFFNLMVYDCAGPWTSIGQLNSPIFWNKNDPRADECEPGGSDQQAAELYLKYLPASQINLGTPFYGYDYTNISQIFEACPNDSSTPDGDCDDTVQTMNYGPNIKQLINKQGWQRYYDPTALVPYLVRTDGTPGFITYDDAFSTYTRVFYADWVLGLGGTFMWSLDADYDGHSQDLLQAMYKATVKSAR